MGIKKQDETISIGASAPAWMLTFSDLMTQLLIFFVMLFALAPQMNEMQLQNLQKRIKTYVDSAGYSNFVFLNRNEKGLVITLKEKFMFESGKADIHEEAKNVITVLMQTIISFNEENPIAVEGHTDNAPIRTAQFPSNWELSTARATNVTRFIVEELKLNPEKISSAGYGEYHPLAPNDTLENRSQNRRVDIIVTRIMGGKKKK